MAPVQSPDTFDLPLLAAALAFGPTSTFDFDSNFYSSQSSMAAAAKQYLPAPLCAEMSLISARESPVGRAARPI